MNAASWLTLGTVAAGLVASVSSTTPCCFDPVLQRVDNATCTCLADDTLLHSNASAGRLARFHWVLGPEDADLLNAPDDDRYLSFHLSPCRGAVRLLLNSVTEGAFPTNSTAKYRSDNLMNENVLTVFLESAEYYVAVLAEADTEFTLSVVTMRGVAPEPGGNGTLDAYTPPPDHILRDGEPMDMELAFRTAEQSLEYQVYFLPRRFGLGPCAEPQRSQAPEECIFTTYCGVLRVGIPVLPAFVPLPPASRAVLSVPGLKRDVEHSFQVLARNASLTGNVTRAVYTPTEGTPTFMRQVAAQSSTVILIILLVAASTVVALALFVVVTKRQMKVKYQRLAERELRAEAAGSQEEAKSQGAAPTAARGRRRGGEDDELADDDFFP